MKRLTIRKLHNNDGVIFVTVLMMIIVMMLLTVTIISINIGQTLSTEDEARRIAAHEIALGMIYYTAAALHSENPPPEDTAQIDPVDNMVYNNQNFPATALVGEAGSGIDETRTVSIRVRY